MNLRLKPVRHYVRRNAVLVFFYVFAYSATILAQTVSSPFTSNDSGIVSAMQGPYMSAVTRLAECEIVGDVQSRSLDTGAMEYRKHLRHTSGQECLLIERFTHTDAGMRWDIEIRGKGKPWSTAIQTKLKWEEPDNLSWWTAWGDPRPNAPRGSPGGTAQASAWWHDPLVPAAFMNARFRYGGDDQFDPEAFSIPIVSVLNAQNDTGVSIVVSPEDLLFQMDLNVEQTG